jgi:hypothetical protein
MVVEPVKKLRALELARLPPAKIDESAIVVPLMAGAIPLTERQPPVANSREDQDRAEAKFRKTLKATWGRKPATPKFEAEARLTRDKTARLRSLRLARAAELKTEREQTPVIPKDKR